MISNQHRILSYLNSNPGLVHWKILSDDTGLNPNSVRGELSRLLYRGKVDRLSKGFYRIKSESDLAMDPPLVHSVQFRWLPDPDFVVFEPVMEDLASYQELMGSNFT